MFKKPTSTEKKLRVSKKKSLILYLGQWKLVFHPKTDLVPLI